MISLPRTRIVFSFFLLLTLSWNMATAATTGHVEQIEGETYVVLENDMARIVVWPDAGAAIVEYVDKRSGTDYCTKGVKKGAFGYGWKERTELHPSTADYMGKLPYQYELRDGDGYMAIVVTCTAEYLRVEREMRLADDSTQLTVLVSHTNVSDTPQSIWLRFHPYMTLDDIRAKTSAIIIPGPGPQNMRRIPVGAGWDAHFMDVPGYWLAANYESGNGIWMTFDPAEVAINATWTDYKFSPHPRRGYFTAELYPKARIVAPGDAIHLRCAYQPFVAADLADDLDVALVPESNHADASRFLKRVRANLDVVSTHTMVPKPNNSWSYVAQNRFYFSHRRRDRFALRDWGIADAMMDISADQNRPVRTRLFARAFHDVQKYFTVSYRLTVRDGAGNTVKQQTWTYAINPSEYDTIDVREDLSIADLPDGRYTFTLEAAEDKQCKNIIHTYVETRKLIGIQKPILAAARREAEEGVPLEQRERPFVTALRTIELSPVAVGVTTVPVGVEEASGIARQAWPVRVGVPFAQGAMPRGAAVTLASPQGAAVPIQTHVMGTWMDGSVKWLLVDFQADVPANGHVFYNLKTVAAPAPAQSNIAVQHGETISVNTGARQWKFSPDDQRVLGLFSPDDIWWQTSSDRQYHFRLEGEDAGISIVENGPMRAVVKVVGWYMADGKTDPIARCEFRAEFYRGKSWHRLEHTFTFAGDPWTEPLAGTGVRFSNMVSGATGVSVDADGKDVRHDRSITLWQPAEDHAIVSSGESSLYTGKRSTGAASLTTADGGATIYHRHLWQLFPKVVTADAATGMIAYDYWPLREKPLDWRPREDGWLPSSSSPQALAVGVSRTHEYVIDPAGTLSPSQCQPLFDEPVIAVTPPRYLCATGALMHLQPYDPHKVPELEMAISEALDSYRLNQELYGWYDQWHFGTLPNMYLADQSRWADFGRYGNLLNEQDVCYVPWLVYLRSGDRRYLAIAEANTKHLMEVGTIRWNPVFASGVGMSRRHHECIWLGAPDYGHSMLDPFAELYHATGYLPAWEAAGRMAQAMAQQRTGAWRYISNPVAGLSRMYLDTQNPFYKKHADRIWTDLCAPDRNTWYTTDHAARMAMYYTPLNADCRKIVQDMANAKGHAKQFQHLDTLAMLYHQTGEMHYAQTAKKLLPKLLANSQRYDPKREDPLQWSIAMHTQHVLAAIRQMVYASAAIEDASKAQTDVPMR